MSLKRKRLLYNILFIGFILFLFSPYGLPIKSKINQGFIYLKSQLISPSLVENSGRSGLDTYNISLNGISNAENVNIENLKGKVIFINHWATWCPPCRAEMPSLNKLYEDYKDKVVFLFVTTDGKRQVEKYYTKNDFNFPTYNLASRIPDKINSNSIPATFILDKNGKVALEEFGPANWNSNDVRNKLDVLLKE